MRSDEIEAALQALLGSAAGGTGLVVTVRRHDEYEILLSRISELEQQIRDKQQEVLRMQSYAVRYIETLDELKLCKKALSKAGLDTSFIRSLGRR